MKMLIAGCAVIAVMGLAACSPATYTPSANAVQAAATAQSNAEAVNSIGMPNIAHHTEMRLVTKLAELRDQPNLATYSYLQGIDGRLHCLGRTIGFPTPYSTQLTNPSVTEQHPGEYGGGNVVLPQSEPNGLYPPPSSDATWVVLVGKDGTPQPIYVEPKVTASVAPLPASIVAEPCS